MQIINIDISGKQTFYCVGKQYDKNATALIFRGIQAAEDESVYLYVNGKKTPLSHNTYVVDETMTALPGDYKAQLTLETEDTKQTLKTFLFRVESTLYKDGEITDHNPGIIDQLTCEATVAEYVLAHADILKGDKGQKGDKGEPGKSPEEYYSKKDAEEEIVIQITDDATLTVQKIHQKKYGNLVEVVMEAEMNVPGDYDAYSFSYDLSDKIQFPPGTAVMASVYSLADSEFTDCSGAVSGLLKPDGTFLGNVVSNTGPLTIRFMYMVDNSTNLFS